MEQLAALVTFSIISAGTPGPNNILLMASGAAFGFRQTLPHVIGTAVGIGALTLAVAAGLGAIITTVPGVALAMKVAGSLYLLYLAWQVAGAGALQDRSIARPLGVQPVRRVPGHQPEVVDLRAGSRHDVPSDHLADVHGHGAGDDHDDPGDPPDRLIVGRRRRRHQQR